MDPNGDGAVHTQSLQRTRLMTVVPPGDEEIPRTMCVVIAGIIVYYWVGAFYSRLYSYPHSRLLFLVWSQIEHATKILER